MCYPKKLTYEELWCGPGRWTIIFPINPVQHREELEHSQSGGRFGSFSCSTRSSADTSTDYNLYHGLHYIMWIIISDCVWGRPRWIPKHTQAANTFRPFGFVLIFNSIKYKNKLALTIRTARECFICRWNWNIKQFWLDQYSPVQFYKKVKFAILLWISFRLKKIGFQCLQQAEFITKTNPKGHNFYGCLGSFWCSTRLSSKINEVSWSHEPDSARVLYMSFQNHDIIYWFYIILREIRPLS